MGGIDAPGERFAATAAVLSCLDLVICCGSSISHLAGALNGRVWLLLATIFAPQWGLAPETPWYPQHELWRQPQLDWHELIEPVRGVLEGFVMRTLARCGIICD